VETGAVLLFLPLLLVNVFRLEAPGWSLPFVAIAGWALADLASGLVHWAGDRLAIRPFREHHDDPRAMTRHDFIETNGASCLGCLPLLAAGAFLPLNPLAHALLVSTAIGALLSNQCHKWAHMAGAGIPRIVRLLQRMRLILPPAMHRRHHTPPHDSHFCTASGWLNRPLDRILRRRR
jgi:ubiquitin-conjugating enzyme E2 variant